jgi:putative transposase
MARIARLVVPLYPHHVTQRGNRRQKTFFSADDYRYYIDLLAEAKVRAGVEIWAYCLMPNHVHLVVVPEFKHSLARLFGDAHRRYTRRVNFREGWRGHLWQERFHSFVMDENYLLATVRYAELNPVRARLCDRPEQWRWSSVHAHLNETDDGLVTVNPMLDRVLDWPGYLAQGTDDTELDMIRRHARTGRPIEDHSFLSELESITGRRLRRGKPGRKSTIK